MNSDPTTLKAAQSGDEAAFARLLSPYQRELRAHCYRMAGSLHDADDLLQDSMLRAWRGLPHFEERANLRTWLYKVTTNACLDALSSRSGRSLPPYLRPPARAGESIGPPCLDPIWLEPCPAELYAAAEATPEATYGRRESVTLAFLVALQLLPAKQRAVLILRDVLGWQAAECAELLELSVAAVNSALQRARETLSSRGDELHRAPPKLEEGALAELLTRYVQAWERADVESLVALLHEDATLAMPPLSEWLAGAQAIGAAISAMVFSQAGPGAFRLVRSEANGLPAFAVYQRDRASGEWRAMAIHLIAASEDRIRSMVAFLDPRLFGAFGFPSLLAP